jgi:hypothetical protein
MNNRDYINSISDIMLCLQSMIRTRFNKKTKIIYTKGRYKSAYLSFYRNHVWQFYVEDKVNHYMVYLLKNENIVWKDFFNKKELVEHFYKKMLTFFRYM